MQQLFADKIHIFKFLSTSGKLWLDQLEILTVPVSTLVVQTSFGAPSVQGRGLPTRKGKYPVLKTNAKPQQLIKHTETSYSIASLVFRFFSRINYRNGLTRGTSKLRHSKYLVCSCAG